MTGQAHFIWHPSARLFAGDTPVPRVRSAKGFQALRADNPRLLQDLGAAVAAGSGFCVSENDLPCGLTPGPGRFFTASGGSTGAPKIIARSQASWTASFAINAARFALGPGRKLAVLGRLSHSLSLYGVLEGLHLGLDVHALAELTPARQARLLKAAAIDTIYATPTQMRLIAATRTLLPAVRLILLGGAHLDPATRQSIMRRCPNAALHVFYGATETSFVALTDIDTPEGAAGHAYPGVEIMVDAGEIWVRSPYLFDGYALGESPDTRWRDGFLSVGERGRIDADGALWIEGRRSRMVTVADHNVSPEPAEALIAARFQPPACAVLPRPDSMRGHRLVAVVEGAEDKELAARIVQACRRELGSHAAPYRVLFRAKLPLLASGKVDLCATASWLEAQK